MDQDVEAQNEIEAGVLKRESGDVCLDWIRNVQITNVLQRSALEIHRNHLPSIALAQPIGIVASATARLKHSCGCRRRHMTREDLRKNQPHPSIPPVLFFRGSNIRQFVWVDTSLWIDHQCSSLAFCSESMDRVW